MVSRDFIHWAHMPISIWNDRDYDEHAIYTGSATVVDGRVVHLPCYPQFSDNCPGGTNLAIAVPADPTDPLQTNWTKDVYAVNPIVNNTGRDPSTAWKTPAGEWRLTTLGHDDHGQPRLQDLVQNRQATRLPRRRVSLLLSFAAHDAGGLEEPGGGSDADARAQEPAGRQGLDAGRHIRDGGLRGLTAIGRRLLRR